MPPGAEKTIDFSYWGRMKHGHDREKTIRQIYRSDLSCQLIGGMPSGVERKSKWIKDWKELQVIHNEKKVTRYATYCIFIPLPM